MEYRMRRCRFFSLTSCTPPGIGLLALAIVCISAFAANKSFRPLGFRQESQALLLARKLSLKTYVINMFEQILHSGMRFGTIFDKGKQK